VRQVTLLFGIHRAIRRAELRRRTRLYFHKNQRVALPRDQIDFAAARIGTVAPRHNRTPVAAQKPVGEVFADAAVVIGQAPAAQRICRAIDEAHHFSTSNSNSITFPRTT
jgi:hypothetical protein